MTPWKLVGWLACSTHLACDLWRNTSAWRTLTSHNSDCPHWKHDGNNAAPNLVLFEELIAADESKALNITTWWGVNYQHSNYHPVIATPVWGFWFVPEPCLLALEWNWSYHFHTFMSTHYSESSMRNLAKAFPGTFLRTFPQFARNLLLCCCFFPEPLANLPCNLLGNPAPGLLPCWSSSPIPPWKHCHTQNYNSIRDDNFRYITLPFWGQHIPSVIKRFLDIVNIYIYII